MSSVSLILQDQENLRKVTETAFRTVDTDGSGFLERKEIEQLMITVSKDIGAEKPTKEDVDEVLKDLDKQGDGKLSLNEFQTLIVQVLQMMVNAGK